MRQPDPSCLLAAMKELRLTADFVRTSEPLTSQWMTEAADWLEYQARQEVENFLCDRGWRPWYHPNYWVHPKTVSDPASQDFTAYGMSVSDAYQYEMDGCPPSDPLTNIPAANMKIALWNRPDDQK